MKNSTITIESYDSIYRNGAVIHWKLRNKGEKYIAQKVLPAFYFDIIIPLNGSIQVDDIWLSEPFASPILKSSKDVIFEPGIEIEGFRFNPLYFSRLTGIQPTQLIQSFNLINRTDQDNTFNTLISKLKVLSNYSYPSTKVKSSYDWLDERIHSHRITLEKLRQAVFLLLDEDLSIKDVASRLNTSPRWIQKLFKRYFNISPRELVRLSRFNQSLKLIMSDKIQSLTSVTYSSNFYDQSHFIRTFRQISGILPSQFAKENHQFFEVMNS